ncbi:alpha-2-macroglobulin-like protein 1 [Mantella aurantiaca]
MQLLLVSVCLVICSSALVSTSDPHYVITVPIEMMEGSQEKACITIQDLDCELHLKLELKKGDHVHEIASQDIKTTDFSHCYSFQVPSVEHSDKDWSFHVSGQGEHIKIDETRKIFISNTFYSCVIETDKSTYKPGDIVKFRLLAVDHNLHISNEKYEKILLTDPSGNHIGQWLDVAPDHGIVDLNYHLAKELKFGEYKFTVSERCSGSFAVAEYVLKRFELLINMPPVAMAAKSFNLEVCGSYTYGKPVQGNLDIEICEASDHYGYFSYFEDSDHMDDDHDSEKCIQINHVKTDSKGCLSREIDLSFFNFSTSDLRQKLQIDSSLTEDGTGHKEKATANLYLSNNLNIKFEGNGFAYKRGVPFNGKIKVSDYHDQPMANTVVVISRREESENKTVLATLETDKDGMAQYSLNTDSWTDDIVLIVTCPLTEEIHDYWMFMRHRSLWLHPFYSESHSFLNVEGNRDTLPCGFDLTVKVDYHISKDQLDSKTDHISFFYFTVNQGGIHSREEYKLDVTEQTRGSDIHGSFPVKVHVDDDLSPQFVILAYTTLPKGETLSNFNYFETDVCFGNKVQLKFSQEKVHPGDKVNLEVSAEAGSLCSVRSVDKGYLLQYPHDDNTFATKIKRSMSRPLGHPRFDWDRESHQCPENQTFIRSREPTFDSSFAFKVCGLELITNTHVKKPVTCVEDGVAARSSTLKKKDGQKDKEDDLSKYAKRKLFPDTWLFELVSVGPEGHTVLNLTTPDSITKWETDAVCLGKSSIGEIRNIGLITFQSYFVDLILPYSVVQGEKFKINAEIFSYDKTCILVAVSLSDVDGLHTVQGKDQVRCVCDGHVSHFSWDATASKPSEMKIHVESRSLQVEGDCKEDITLITSKHKEDSVEKSLLVKARGYEEQTTETHLLYSKDTAEKVVFTLNTPDALVPGSERAHIIVVGDIMGNIIVNLENILDLPDGCGEQSISKLSRYCYSLEYLKSANELTPKTKENFLEHMTESFQKQLTFKSDSGGYNLYPGSDPNIWITALVVKAFSCVQQFIPIDQKHIPEAIHWLESKQQPDGSFHSSDSYMYYGTEDETDEKLRQTAFVLISLLQYQTVHNESIVENAKSYIRKHAEDTKKPRILALLAYAFALLGESELKAHMLKHLDDHAEKQSGSKHWPDPSYQHSDVEITSYVIMCLLSDKIITHENLEESSSSVRWLTSNQNPWGGFSSSQDTTIALQALSKYATATTNKKGDSTIIIEDNSGFHKEIHIDQRNNLLVQTVDLPKVPGTYTASITGNGCVYIQSHLHYNSLPHEHDVHFAVNVTTNPAVCTHDAEKKFEVHVDARYIGKRSKTNMALIQAQLLSGFVPDRKSIRKLKKHPDVKRVDVLPEEIDIYLDELNHENKHFVFTIEQETHVDNLQPAHVEVFDYYIPEISALDEYNMPCSKSHCNVHASERKDCGRPEITKEECERNGCCFDASINNAKWCFFHDTTIIQAEEGHQNYETHQTQEAH